MTTDDWENFQEGVREASQIARMKCGITTFLNSLDEAGKAAVQEVLADESFTNAGISRALQKRLGDRAPSPWSVSRHRRGECIRCEYQP